MYICSMKTEITIPEHFPELKEKDIISADERRREYSSKRDIQANEFNVAIASRLERDSEKKENEPLPLLEDDASK